MGGTAFPRLAQAGLDWPTMMFTILVAVATGLFFGVVPALQVSQSATQDSLREGGRSSTAGGHHQHVRRLLVVAEVALSLALLSGAGLLIKSFMRLLEVDPGFKSEGILTMRVVLPQARYSQPEQMRNFFRELMDRVSTIPGVQSVGAINALPLSGTGGSGTTTLEAASVATDQASPEADWRVVTTGYFETIGTQLVAGRYFEARDNESAAPVAIIDESMARTYWPNDDPIGKRLKRGGPQSPNPWMTVVGVVRHVRYQSLERPSRVQLYWPHAQTPATGMSLAVRTSVEPGSIASAVQRAAAGLDPDQPVYAIRTMDELLGESMLRRRLVMILLVIFAAVALTLAAMGIYGVISYWVAQRSHEIGIRMALGATRGDVLRMVVGESLAVVVVGVVTGLAGSIALTRLITSLLFNVTATDPATFVAVCASLLAVGLLASAIPALRATWVDPVHTLRQD
jgi:putative ABC transport system permease protein